MSITKVSHFDIQSHNAADFILDTNILFFIHAGYQQKPTKETVYSQFIQQLLTNGAKIFVSVFTIQELFHSIENTEYRLYCSNNNRNEKKFTKKHFRKNATLRAGVQQKLAAVLTQITALYTVENADMQPDQLKQFVRTFHNHRYDPMDYVLVKIMTATKGAAIFVTDDTDFGTDPSIDVVTI